jgi:hypothetical protein
MAVPSRTLSVSDSRKAEVASLAEAVAAEHFATTARIDPEMILARKHITLSFGHYVDAFDGLLEHREGRFHVYCNLDRVERRDAPRARFTLAHELGHFFIDEHRNALRTGRVPSHPSICEFESKNPAEQEADLFASNLLMPATRFATRARRATRGLSGVLKLAEEFGTSVTSTAIRYLQVEPLPCIILKWSEHGLEWSWASDAIYRARWGARVNQLSDLPHDSATARALRGDSAGANDFFENGSTAAAWFRNVAAGADRNELMIEQAIRLGRFGVLTLLYPHGGRLQLHGILPDSRLHL